MKLLSVTIENCCEIVGIRKTTAYKLIKAGKLTPLKIGRRTLITMQSVEALIAQAVIDGDA